MKLLALDTSSVACSVALECDGEVVARHEEQAREHTRLLVPMVREVLEEAQLQLAALDALVLGNGPGSFIGMRIAASIAQGLAFGAGLRIVPVSSMAAVAAQVLSTGDSTEVVVAQDAHMNEVYLGIYRSGHVGLPEEVIAERLQGQEVIPELQRRAAGKRVAAGYGWHRYPELLAFNKPFLDGTSDVLHPNARFLLAAGASGLAAGAAVAPEEVVPAYLRQKVARKPAAGRP